LRIQEVIPQWCGGDYWRSHHVCNQQCGGSPARVKRSVATIDVQELSILSHRKDTNRINFHIVPNQRVWPIRLVQHSESETVSKQSAEWQRARRTGEDRADPRSWISDASFHNSLLCTVHIYMFSGQCGLPQIAGNV
jgi:hypothetical protein